MYTRQAPTNAPINVAALARPPLVSKAVIATPKPEAVRRMLAAAGEHDPAWRCTYTWPP